MRRIFALITAVLLCLASSGAHTKATSSQEKKRRAHQQSRLIHTKTPCSLLFIGVRRAFFIR